MRKIFNISIISMTAFVSFSLVLGANYIIVSILN
jgi:hypothetical protein